MPNFAQFRPGGGAFVLEADRALPPDQQVTWHHRDPLPSEVAETEDSSGYSVLGQIRIGRNDVDESMFAAAERRWVSHGASNAINLLVKLITDVTGPGPDGQRLDFPNGEIRLDDGGARRSTRVDKERFFAQFMQSDLYEIAKHIEDRRALTEDELGN